jgi:phosphatidylserine/phosphatidylglycerophosphate/cardiolipin synthase-like enzyme
MAGEYQVSGKNTAALFTLKLHRGDGMALLAMNWKNGKPPEDFVGFAIEYKEPEGDKFYPLKNRLAFPRPDGSVNPIKQPTTLAPIQKFRWVHFPRNAELAGEFVYRVSPVFMNSQDELSYGEYQEALIELQRETYPRQLNVAFTRGYVSSQAFVEKYESKGSISTLLPAKSEDGLTFNPTHPLVKEALPWMGFEARSAILEVLDQAIADTKAQVSVVAYDLNEPEIVSRLKKLKTRLRIIIDNEGAHGKVNSAENQAEKILSASAGNSSVKRQHMGQLQHNKTIVVNGPMVKIVVCGSTNFSWRGLYVQSNNAMVLRGKNVVDTFSTAFENYWNNTKPSDFGATDSAKWTNLGLTGINAKVSFSPHSKSNALLQSVANDISANTTSCLFYSLAFLYQTPGPILNAIKAITTDNKIFVYGISDRKVGGIDFQKPDGNVEPVYPSTLAGKGIPEPFKSEPTGGGGVRMHHKFIVLDFDKPTARVYLGSYNFSDTADTKNGENLLLVRDRRIAVSYMIEALSIFDHYHFRVNQVDAKKMRKKLVLAKSPRNPGDTAWWVEDYTDTRKIRDRELFA